MTGESYDLNCSVSEVAVTRYRWTKRGNNTYSNQSLLSFPSLILSDAGEYTCEVEVDSRNYSRMTTITLQSLFTSLCYVFLCNDCIIHTSSSESNNISDNHK